MTIICIKDGIVAADGAGFSGDVITSFSKQKLIRSPDGAIGGAAGPTCDVLIFRRWFSQSTVEQRQAAGTVPLSDMESGLEMLWLEPGGEIWTAFYDGKPYPLEAKMAATGSLWQVAQGAMLAGATAEEAVLICIENGVSAAGQVCVERLMSADEPPAETAQTSQPLKPAMFSEEWRQNAGLA